MFGLHVVVFYPKKWFEAFSKIAERQSNLIFFTIFWMQRDLSPVWNEKDPWLNTRALLS